MLFFLEFNYSADGAVLEAQTKFKYSTNTAVSEAQIRALKPKRGIVRMPRNMFTDQRTLNQREQLRAKLRRKQEQKAKAEAEQSKSN